MTTSSRGKEPPEGGDGSGESLEEFLTQGDPRAVPKAEESEARRSEGLRYDWRHLLVGLALLAAITAINFVVFAAFGGAYLDWYLQNGSIIAFVFAVVAVAIDLDREWNLIAAHPLNFLTGIGQLVTQVLMAIRQLLSPAWADAKLAEMGGGYGSLQSRYRSPTLDSAVTILFALTFIAAMLAWALVVAPLQYWVNLLCGAPARTGLASQDRTYREDRDGLIRLVLEPETKGELEDAHKSGTVSVLSFASKPVTFTAAIAAAVLWAVSQLI